MQRAEATHPETREYRRGDKNRLRRDQEAGIVGREGKHFAGRRRSHTTGRPHCAIVPMALDVQMMTLGPAKANPARRTLKKPMTRASDTLRRPVHVRGVPSSVGFHTDKVGGAR